MYANMVMMREVVGVIVGLLSHKPGRRSTLGHARSSSLPFACAHFAPARLSNRRDRLPRPSLPRTHLATFAAVRSNLSLPTCQGAFEEGVQRFLHCPTVIMSLVEVVSIKIGIFIQLNHCMPFYFNISK